MRLAGQTGDAGRNPPATGTLEACQTLPPRARGRSCSPPRAATAPASTAPCRRSSARSRSTAPPSTSARRSSTTSTWSSSSPRAARSSSSRRPRCRRARSSSSPPTASPRRSTTTPPTRNLRTIDATCPLVTKVHVSARRFAAAGYTIVMIGHAGPRGGRRDDRRGARRDRPDRNRRRGRGARGPRPRQGRLHHPDDALGRRDRRGDRRPARQVPVDRLAASPTTSVTRRPTARSRSSSWPPSATWCW